MMISHLQSNHQRFKACNIFPSRPAIANSLRNRKEWQMPLFPGSLECHREHHRFMMAARRSEETIAWRVSNVISSRDHESGNFPAGEAGRHCPNCQFQKLRVCAFFCKVILTLPRFRPNYRTWLRYACYARVPTARYQFYDDIKVDSQRCGSSFRGSPGFANQERDFFGPAPERSGATRADVSGKLRCLRNA